MKKTAFLLSLLVFAFIAGCGGGGGSDGAGANSGTLKVNITDAPATHDFASVWVTIEKVVVVPAGSEELHDDDSRLPVVVTYAAGRKMNIMNLRFVQEALGSAVLPAGRYSQVRLILAANQPTLKNYMTLTSDPDHEIPLTTPSAQRTGLKIPGTFTVTAGTLNTIVLDFDPNTAIVFRGNSGEYNLKPTGIRILQIYNSISNAAGIRGEIRSPLFQRWSTAKVTVRNSFSSAVTAGVVFSNFSSPGVWKSSFTAYVPANRYRVYVQAYRDTMQRRPVFPLYSSPPFNVTSGTYTEVPPDGTILLAP